MVSLQPPQQSIATIKRLLPRLSLGVFNVFEVGIEVICVCEVVTIEEEKKLRRRLLLACCTVTILSDICAPPRNVTICDICHNYITDMSHKSRGVR